MELEARETASLKAVGWSRHDTLWVLGIYGCAVGGGSLFWPLSLGLQGFWPMLILSLLAFPVTYFPYRALGQYVLSGSNKSGHDGNLLDTTIEHFGVNWGKALTTIYFLTVFPGMMIYTIIITNTIIDFLNSQLHVGSVPRWIVAPVSIFLMMVVVRYGTTAVVKAMGYIVIPFITLILIVSVVAAPHWNSAMLQTIETSNDLGAIFLSSWKGIPLTVFAFSFTSILSQFVVAQKRRYGRAAAKKVSSIMMISTVMVVSTVMLFSWSCIFALSPAELAAAKADNLTVLSFLSRKFSIPALAYASQLIVFTAVVKAFLAHYIATEESARAFGRAFFNMQERTLKGSHFSWLVVISVFMITTASAIANLDVVNLITMVFVPLNVFVVYFIPLYAFHRIDSLKQYRWQPSNVLVTAVGVACLINSLHSIVQKFLL